MSCKHSLIGTPDRCSQCIGHSPVRRVSLDGTAITIDGEPVAKHEPDRSYFVRGGKRKRLRKV